MGWLCAAGLPEVELLQARLNLVARVMGGRATALCKCRGSLANAEKGQSSACRWRKPTSGLWRHAVLCHISEYEALYETLLDLEDTCAICVELTASWKRMSHRVRCPRLLPVMSQLDPLGSTASRSNSPYSAASINLSTVW